MWPGPPLCSWPVLASRAGHEAWWGRVTSCWLWADGQASTPSVCGPGSWPVPCPALCPPSSQDVIWDLLSASAGSQAICPSSLESWWLSFSWCQLLALHWGPPARAQAQPAVSCRRNPGWSPGACSPKVGISHRCCHTCHSCLGVPWPLGRGQGSWWLGPISRQAFGKG